MVFAIAIMTIYEKVAAESVASRELNMVNEPLVAVI